MSSCWEHTDITICFGCGAIKGMGCYVGCAHGEGTHQQWQCWAGWASLAPVSQQQLRHRHLHTRCGRRQAGNAHPTSSAAHPCTLTKLPPSDFLYISGHNSTPIAGQIWTSSDLAESTEKAFPEASLVLMCHVRNEPIQCAP